MTRSFACLRCALLVLVGALSVSGCSTIVDDALKAKSGRDGGSTGGGDSSVSMDANVVGDGARPDAVSVDGAAPDVQRFDVIVADIQPLVDVRIICSVDMDCRDTNVCNGVERCVEGMCVSTPVADGFVACEGDGDPATNELCRTGSCVSSSCGDQIVDARRNEQCDDSSTVLGDGCDSCRFSCESSATCDDGIFCNGTETCSAETHRCVAGLQQTGACSVTAAIMGTCRGGVCSPPNCPNNVVDPGEQCDDNNTTAGDGCEPDCTYSCESDAECTNNNVCDGVETCNTENHRCSNGTAPPMPVAPPCSDQRCDAVQGWISTIRTDADGDSHAPVSCGGDDCDDNDGEIHPGRPEACDSKDNDCNRLVDDNVAMQTYYKDVDRDGYGRNDTGVLACRPPSTDVNWVTRGGDCYDSNAFAYPGQSDWFTDERGDGSFDYNCAGGEEPKTVALQCGTFTSCRIGAILCSTGSTPACCASPLGDARTTTVTGWIGTTRPSCGGRMTTASCPSSASITAPGQICASNSSTPTGCPGGHYTSRASGTLACH